MIIFCECNSFDCDKTIDIPLNELDAIRDKDLRSIIIVNGCPRGAEPTDVLISHKEGYSVYRESP